MQYQTTLEKKNLERYLSKSVSHYIYVFIKLTYWRLNIFDQLFYYKGRILLAYKKSSLNVIIPLFGEFFFIPVFNCPD